MKEVTNNEKVGLVYSYNLLILLVPGAGIEPARHEVTRDFKLWKGKFGKCCNFNSLIYLMIFGRLLVLFGNIRLNLTLTGTIWAQFEV
jgi:hypothetical protein